MTTTLVALFNLQADAEAAAHRAASSTAGLIWLLVIVLVIVSMWRIFDKAGQPGWAAIIPIYNLYVLLKVAGRPGWWLLLCLIPVVNLLVMLVVDIDVARRFGKTAAFGVGMWLLFFIFYPILAFGDARYQA
jgi:Family of unknown function (DUF5684)